MTAVSTIMIRSSLMNTVEVFMMPPRWIPSKFMWENYQEVFDTLPFGKYFLNSFIVTGGCVVGTMLTSSICAYGLARIKWRGRNVVFACIISSMMLPVAVTLIPIVLHIRNVGIKVTATGSIIRNACSCVNPYISAKAATTDCEQLYPLLKSSTAFCILSSINYFAFLFRTKI